MLSVSSVLTLYFSSPPVEPSTLQPVLQILSFFPSTLPQCFLLSDGLQCLRACSELVPLDPSNPPLQKLDIIKLNDYRVDVQPDNQK